MIEPPIVYVPEFIKNPDITFSILRDELDWERRSDAPRCEYFVSDFDKPYTYGRGKGIRTYYPRYYHPMIRSIRSKLEIETGYNYEVCFLNRYLDQSDHLDWHQDDSPEMDDSRPIASISLGAEREIWIKHVSGFGISGGDIGGGTHKYKLSNGSLFLMQRGMQDHWKHRIPKCSYKCGERISLVFRGYVDEAN